MLVCSGWCWWCCCCSCCCCSCCCCCCCWLKCGGRSWALKLGMLIRDTSGRSGAGGVAYQTEADFFMTWAGRPSCGCCCGCVFSSCCRRPCVTPPKLRMMDGSDVDDPDHGPPRPSDGLSGCSPRRNSSMSARNVLGRSGSSNGYDGDDGDADVAVAVAAAIGSGPAAVGGADRFSRRFHTSFMAHCRFSLFTNDSGLAVVPIGELKENPNVS